MDTESLKEFLVTLYQDVDNKYKEAIEKLGVSNPKAASLLQKCKYSIFYSNPLTTLKEGPIYTLGLNPGGTPDDGTTFRLERMKFFQKYPNWSEYLCAKWKTKNRWYPRGKAPLQVKIKTVLEFILDKLGHEPKIGETFATNLYFFRSPGDDMLQKYGWKNYDCWKYHETFLKIVKPKIIVCIGNGNSFSPFSELANKFKIDLPPTTIKHLYGRFWLKSFFLETPSWTSEKVLVLGLPHLSRFWPGDLNVDKHKFYDSIEKMISDL